MAELPVAAPTVAEAPVAEAAVAGAWAAPAAESAEILKAPEPVASCLFESPPESIPSEAEAGLKPGGPVQAGCLRLREPSYQQPAAVVSQQAEAAVMSFSRQEAVVVPVSPTEWAAEVQLASTGPHRSHSAVRICPANGRISHSRACQFLPPGRIIGQSLSWQATRSDKSS